MGLIQAQRYCKECDRKTLHARSTFGLGWGVLLSILTVGAFLPIWLLIKVYEAIAVKWRCQACGRGRHT